MLLTPTIRKPAKTSKENNNKPQLRKLGENLRVSGKKREREYDAISAREMETERQKEKIRAIDCSQ